MFARLNELLERIGLPANSRKRRQVVLDLFVSFSSVALFFCLSNGFFAGIAVVSTLFGVSVPLLGLFVDDGIDIGSPVHPWGHRYLPVLWVRIASVVIVSSFSLVSILNFVRSFYGALLLTLIWLMGILAGIWWCLDEYFRRDMERSLEEQRSKTEASR